MGNAVSTVLIVDGSPFFRAQLGKTLEKNGFYVLQAGDASEAFLLVDAEKPDLILLGVEMPGMSGLDVCRILRERESPNFTPIILLSSRGKTGDKLHGLSLGADDYIVKPCNEKEILFRIRNTLRLIKVNRSVNPLTGLPGNIDIQRELSARLGAARDFTAVYLDIDNFKAFNDKYGFLEGDKVIKQTAEIIAKQVRLFGQADDFVGHVGGDDFVFLSSEEEVEDICSMIGRSFDESILQVLLPEDAQCGCITTINRKGEVETLPLTSISMAVVPCPKGRFSRDLEIAAVAAELKHRAKCIVGSAYVVDRRK